MRSPHLMVSFQKPWCRYIPRALSRYHTRFYLKSILIGEEESEVTPLRLQQVAAAMCGQTWKRGDRLNSEWIATEWSVKAVWRKRAGTDNGSLFPPSPRFLLCFGPFLSALTAGPHPLGSKNVSGKPRLATSPCSS